MKEILSNPKHPLWGLALFAVFAIVRVAMCSTIDGDELRDILLVMGFVGRDFLQRDSASNSPPRA